MSESELARVIREERRLAEDFWSAGDAKTVARLVARYTAARAATDDAVQKAHAGIETAYREGWADGNYMGKCSRSDNLSDRWAHRETVDTCWARSDTLKTIAPVPVTPGDANDAR